MKRYLSLLLVFALFLALPAQAAAAHEHTYGEDGVCTVCGQLIRKPRLLNQPFVLTCMECQSEMERNRS